MDEVAWRLKYNETVSMVKNVTSPENKQCMLLMLQLMADLLHTINELRDEYSGDEDDE